MKTFLFLCVFHVVGDYILQWKKMAKEKAPFNKYFNLHVLLYAFAMAVVFLCAPIHEAVLSWFAFSISHMIIDIIRSKVDKCFESNRTAKVFSFCIDQFLHLSCILLCYAFILRSHPGYLNQMLFAQPWFQPFLGCLVILCVIWRPTEILISKVLSMFPIEIKKDESGSNDTERKASTEKALKAGKYIGFLERVIVVVLVMLNAPTAIGFVLTAKSVARFKQLEDQSFAERYLVGTLLSVGIALVTVLLIPKIYPFI